MTAPALDPSDLTLAASLKPKTFADRVLPSIWVDQHGREWSCQDDKDTGHPATPLTPVGWAAPYPMLFPPQKYLKVGRRRGLLHIDYPQWLIDLSASTKEYATWLRQVARQQFGSAAIQKIQENDAELLALAGPPPASVEFVKAMAAGNKWALGTPRPDGTPYPCPPWATPFLETLAVFEAYDGSDADLSVDAHAYPDVEDEIAMARYDEYDTYGDVEEAVDPDALPDFVPIKPTKPVPGGRGKRR